MYRIRVKILPLFYGTTLENRYFLMLVPLKVKIIAKTYTINMSNSNQNNRITICDHENQKIINRPAGVRRDDIVMSSTEHFVLRFHSDIFLMATFHEITHIFTIVCRASNLK